MSSSSPWLKTRVAAAVLTVSAAVVTSTMQKEGFRDKAYPDPATRGAPWTLGYGATAGVKPGDRTTQPEAMARLTTTLDAVGSGVAGCLSAPVSQGEFDASVDLAYNIGIAAYCQSSVARRFNSQDYWGGCMAILLYTKARVGGQLVNMPGLITRRWDEYYTCLSA